MRNQKGYMAGYNGQAIVTAEQVIVGAMLWITYRDDPGRAMTIDVRAQTDPGQLAVVSTEHATPTAAWLIRPAASDESSAVAPDSRITGNARVPRPPG